MLCIPPNTAVMPPLPIPLYFRLTFTRQNIWQRGKINQYAPINAVKVARKHKQHSESIPGCRGILRWRPKCSLTLFRTMQSAASVEKGYGVVPFFFSPFWTQWSRANAATFNEARCGCAIAAQGGDYWFSDYGYCRRVEWMANSSLSLTAMAAGTEL